MSDDVLITSRVSAEFGRECNAAWEALPGGIRELLRAHGVTVRCIRSVWEQMPELTSAPMRGGGRTAENLPAFYRDRVIVVPEFHVSQATGRIERVNPPGAFLCHEIGHALDDALGRHQGNGGATFRQAYQADLDAMTSGQRMDLLYFVEPRAGRRETFAEAFAVAVDRPTPGFGDRVSAAFPRSVALMKGIMKELKEARQ